jgi:hypothetical protein
MLASLPVAVSYAASLTPARAFPIANPSSPNVSSVSPAGRPGLFEVAPELRSHMRLITDDQIDANIDRALNSADRRIMHDVMAKLPELARTNVTYVMQNGRVLTNHIAMLSQVRVHQIRNNSYVDESGRVISVPGVTRKPAFQGGRVIPEFSVGDNNTGPFRQMYSVPNWGYIQFSLIIPCNVTQVRSSETPYAYLGGWSAIGAAEDAGFQWSQANNWGTLFSKYQGVSQIDAPDHVQCGKQNGMSFYPISFTQIGVTGNGYSTTPNKTFDQTIVQQVPGGDGWGPYCYGCAVKRTTSIAQSGDNFSDGSYFGTLFGSQPQVQWKNGLMALGVTRCIPENPPIYYYCFTTATAYPSSSNIAGFGNVPNDNTKLLVQPGSGNYYTGETDGIYLHP